MQEEPVRLVRYNSQWPALFEAERALLESVLQPWLVGPIEHIGSTAVPGLIAKPVIDIMAGVRDLEAALPSRDAAATLGYLYFPYRPREMHWFCKPSPTQRTHHLHLVPVDSPLWRERLVFRDYLRESPETAARYAELKRDLAARYEFDREAYTDGKSDFVNAALHSARRELDQKFGTSSV
ncbi:MAG TPA: GrpB family protein [Vicinamibacterales bacterium]|nr:GrpB family protein [Vicinamibacterales bacterium]